ncbi:hypothetical protein THAOC_18235, partial [Thalassiosira oceanica]
GAGTGERGGSGTDDSSSADGFASSAFHDGASVVSELDDDADDGRHQIDTGGRTPHRDRGRTPARERGPGLAPEPPRPRQPRGGGPRLVLVRRRLLLVVLPRLVLRRRRPLPDQPSSLPVRLVGLEALVVRRPRRGRHGLRLGERVEPGVDTVRPRRSRRTGGQLGERRDRVPA